VALSLLLESEGNLASARGLTLLWWPPGIVQAESTFWQMLRQIDQAENDPRVVRGLVRSPAAYASLRYARSKPQLREALVLGDRTQQATLVLLCAAMFARDPGVVAAIVRRLDDDDAEVRWRAALGISWSVGSAAALEAVPSLVERLGDPDETVRAFAAGALAKIAPWRQELAPALERLAAGRGEVARRVASIVEAERKSTRFRPAACDRYALAFADPAALTERIRIAPRATSRPSSR
jgi:hypothetical protein